MHQAKAKTDTKLVGISPYVLSLREELRTGSMKRHGQFELGDLDVEVCQGRDSVWAIIRREGQGGLALRAAYVPNGDIQVRKRKPEEGVALELEIESVIGSHSICFTTSSADLHRLLAQVTFTPTMDMRIPFIPRDLYPLDENDDPIGATGNVEAAQRGHNSGLLYFRFDKPAFGSVLYFQDLTVLNPYFLATHTTPYGVVGGEWPELGYLPPTPESQSVPDPVTLRAGEEVTLSKPIIVVRDWAGDTEQEMARQFLQMLGTAYAALEQPKSEYRDWVDRAERTIRDLQTAPQARRKEYGHLYVMPYPDGEYPDVMVQLSVAQALHEWGVWKGEPHPLEAELLAGIEKFYDKKFKTLRRYLPNVGEEQGKDPDAVDSWYLYHPMLNLGRLALDGDERCRDLLLSSIDYGIKAAQHFDYAWPIMYKLQDFSVIQEARGDERFGQTDVGGIYAYVMLQCFELTGEDRFVQEARKAIDKAKELRFDLLYQANLTVWGAVACMRLWRITDDQSYLDQSYSYLAGFFHNAIIWESQLGTARHFKTFLGVTCLHDAPYMAMYECFESFAGFDEYLRQSGPQLEPAVRLMVSEYCRYVLDRAWFYYPDALPPEAIQEGDHQSGVINRELSFPLEDLYPDGQPAGQVGQEIYGCGAAFAFATRSHHDVEDAPFRLYCNYFIGASERTGERALSIQLDGGESCFADVSLVRLKRKQLPEAAIITSGGDKIRPYASSEDRIDFRVPASGRFILTWE
ncbi:MAG TPA: hypothetical protein VKY80_04495 [Croceibacterium sp.]|nr:hypothetical protein [Croceibacterium sp.]